MMFKVTPAILVALQLASTSAQTTDKDVPRQLVRRIGNEEFGERECRDVASNIHTVLPLFRFVLLRHDR